MAVYPGLLQYDYNFRISPIFLTGGIAGSVPGGAMPIVTLLQPGLFSTLVDIGFGDLAFDNYFAHFRPVPGATLIQDEVGHYPFANQATAANAIIAQPLRVSLLMECSVRPPMTLWGKFQLMQALRSTLAQHRNMGGTYTVMTPTYPYQNCLLLQLQALPEPGEQEQVFWQWDFEQPLLSLQTAAQAYSNLMGKMAANTPLTMDSAGQLTWSGTSTTNGLDTSGSLGGTAIPASSGLAGNLAGASTGPAPVGNAGADQSGGSSNTAPSPAPTGSSLTPLAPFGPGQ